jgi:hypothetical protein
MIGTRPTTMTTERNCSASSNPSLFSPKVVTAIEHIRPMRGGSQPHLMRCSDGHYYVVKFANNPQGVRTLANEYLAGKLAALIGLPCPEISLISVDEKLVRLTPELAIHWPQSSCPVTAGLAFGSRYPLGVSGAERILPPVQELGQASGLGRMENPSDLMGILMFDKWTGNTDRRQLLCLPRPSKNWRTYRILMIDNGFCFAGQSWQFRDSPLRGLHVDMDIYAQCQNPDALVPWLFRLRTRATLKTLNEIADDVPRSWFRCRHDFCTFRELVHSLYKRKQKVSMLVQETLAALRSRTYKNLARRTGLAFFTEPSQVCIRD